MDDNPALSPKIRQRYKNSYSGTFYQRFILGQWSAAKGLVYDFFDPASFAPPPPDGPFDQFAISVDYGTVNPCSMGLWALKNGVWFRIQEFYYNSKLSGVQMTDQEYLSALRTLAGGRPIHAVAVDPSAASFITTLQQAGFHTIKAVNDVLSGIRLTAGLLKNHQIVVCNSCTDCLREFSLYRWDDSPSGKDAPKKENDHAMDDLRYFAATIAAPPQPPIPAFQAVPRPLPSPFGGPYEIL